MTPYEERREANLRRNEALLRSIGLDKPFFDQSKAKPKVAREKQPRKRKIPPSVQNDESPAKSLKRDVGQTAASMTPGPRRSTRHAGKLVDYSETKTVGQPVPVSVKSRMKDGFVETDARTLDRRVHDPKRFGHIPGVPVGTEWETREACSKDAIHAPWVAGIAGSAKGAYSVCLSGGYEDDVDFGYGFTYTGSGGRDLKGTKNAPKNLRTAPQSCDQSFENSFNKALKISSETGRPVRVVRGFKLKSKFAPHSGYRYDGLYTVEKAWIESGLNAKGYLVCKFAFKRLDGQTPLPGDQEDESEPLLEYEDETESDEEDEC